jgi:predicted nucleic acid-binding protein
MIVVDASVILDALLAGDSAAAGALNSGEPVCAPHLLDVEVAQVLRRLAGTSSLAPSRAAEALAALEVLPVLRFPHYQLLPRIWELRHSLTAYDAAYVALAESLEAVLLTRDRRMASAHGHHARVMLV